MKNIKEKSNDEAIVYDREIAIPYKLKEKLDNLQKERERINNDIDSIFQNLIEGFLSDKDINETQQVIYRPDTGIFGVKNK